MDKEVTVSSGIGLPTLLFITFLVLKLTGVIGWSWLWVFAPLWIPALIVVIVVVFCLLMAIITKQF